MYPVSIILIILLSLLSPCNSQQQTDTSRNEFRQYTIAAPVRFQPSQFEFQLWNKTNCDYEVMIIDRPTRIIVFHNMLFAGQKVSLITNKFVETYYAMIDSGKECWLDCDEKELVDYTKVMQEEFPREKGSSGDSHQEFYVLFGFIYVIHPPLCLKL